jgi:starch phosphorylase
MKAIANGVLHFSTADGWWARSYKPDVGWLIGSEKEYEDPKYQEELESNSFYNLLEHEIAPLFYDRGANGLPHRWIQKMKIAMHYLCPKFNAHRMLEEYMTKSYESAFHYWQKLTQKDMEGLKLLSQWKNKIMTNWNKISILSIEPKEGIEIKMGEKLKITTLIRLEELTPEDIKVEIHYGPLSISGEFEKKNIIPMNLIQQENKNIYRFEANLNCIDTGKFGYRLTIIPSHPYLISSYYLLGELVIWG